MRQEKPQQKIKMAAYRLLLGVGGLVCLQSMPGMRLDTGEAEAKVGDDGDKEPSDDEVNAFSPNADHSAAAHDGTAAASAAPSAPPSNFPANGLSTAILPVETELALTKSALENIARRLETAKQLTERLGLGPQTAAAERAWKNAQWFYVHHEWSSTIRELNNYLNQTQVPATAPYLKAQYMLGRSYEESHLTNKALKAYSRYLATFLTAKAKDHPDHDELVDVLQRMIPLAAMEPDPAKQLGELLASITTLELPADVEPLVFYYAAKAAVNSGSTAMGSTWLEKTIAAPDDPTLRARAKYIQALIAIGKKDYARAEEILIDVTTIDQEGTAKDQARLALARLAVRQRRRDSALKYYSLIGEGSSAFKDAVFESIYVHLDLKQDSDVRAKALLYVTRWPDTVQALQLRMLLAYLDLRVGDLDAATKSIAAADQRLKDIHQWLSKNLATRSTVTPIVLNDLINLTGGQLPAAPAAKAAAVLFSRLAEVSRRLSDLQGEVNNTIFTIGRANLAQLRPFWVNRSEQLAAIGDELLRLGHRLVAAERHLYADQLTPVEAQKLAAGESRRTRLLTPPAASRRKMHYWESFASASALVQRLAAAYQKHADTQAKLNAASALNLTAAASADGANRRLRLAEMQTQSRKVGDQLRRALVALRRHQVRNLLAQSPHRATGKFIAQYSSALHEEAQILARPRDGAVTAAQRLNAEDAAMAWRRWEFLLGEVFRQISTIDRDVYQGLNGMLAELDTASAKTQELLASTQELSANLEANLGKSLAYVVSQYTASIDARFARHQKWRADIDWMTYQNQVDVEGKVSERFELEQQILKDNLIDLQQGVLWKWPN